MPPSRLSTISVHRSSPSRLASFVRLCLRVKTTTNSWSHLNRHQDENATGWCKVPRVRSSMRDARASRETSGAAQGVLRQSKWQSPEVVAGLQKRASRRKSGRHLHLREAAIREQFCSRNIAAVVGGEKYDSFRNLIGCSKPAEGNHAFDHGAALLVRLGGIQQVAQSRGIDPAWAYGVDADAPVFQVSRPCARERAHGRLGGAVNTDRWQPFAGDD